MATAKVTSRGRITIPLAVRRGLSLEPGSRVEFVARTDGSYVIVSAGHSVKDLQGIVRTRRRAVSIDQMDDAVADSVSSTTI